MVPGNRIWFVFISTCVVVIFTYIYREFKVSDFNTQSLHTHTKAQELYLCVVLLCKVTAGGSECASKLTRGSESEVCVREGGREGDGIRTHTLNSRAK